MRRKKQHMLIMAAVIMTLVMVTAAGCGSERETAGSVDILSVMLETEAEEDVEEPDEIREADSTAQSFDADNEDIAPDGGETPDNEKELDSRKEPEYVDNSEETMIIGGKVRSVSQETFVISRTLIEDSIVIMPEPGSPEEELVSIRCTDATVFEHWIIQGGGAGITKEEAAYSDITVGGGLEAVGCFDGEEFMAEKVIVETYQ